MNTLEAKSEFAIHLSLDLLDLLDLLEVLESLEAAFLQNFQNFQFIIKKNYALNMIGLIDCNNFYVSCERVFNPRLEGRRVAVLTNNDGCVVSRSPEFKKLNIPVGTPYFKIKDLEKPLDLVFISSNYELYADMSSRVMSVLRQFTPHIEQYSIDEAFVHFNLPESHDYESLAIELRERVRQWTGIPTGIGFASTRTLAKLGSEIAKKRTNTGVFVMPKHAEDILQETPVGDIWGVGPRVEKRLMALGIRTARQLAEADLPWLQKKFSVCLVRTALELNGQKATAAEDFGHPLKTATCSRMFGVPIVDFEELRQSVAEYAETAAEKMRESGRQAVGASVFFLYYPEYYPVALPEGGAETNVMFGHPTNNTAEIFAAIAPHLPKIFQNGRRYKKSGIIFFGLEKGTLTQPELFPAPARTPISDHVVETLDTINRQFGRDTVHCLASGLSRPWTMRREKLSSRYTTDWDGLPLAK